MASCFFYSVSVNMSVAFRAIRLRFVNFECNSCSNNNFILLKRPGREGRLVDGNIPLMSQITWVLSCRCFIIIPVHRIDFFKKRLQFYIVNICCLLWQDQQQTKFISLSRILFYSYQLWCQTTIIIHWYKKNCQLDFTKLVLFRHCLWYSSGIKLKLLIPHM